MVIYPNRLLKKTQPIIYKEKVPVAVPVPEPVPVAEPSYPSYPQESYPQENNYESAPPQY